MTALLVAEFRRIAARRLVRLTVVLACVGIALGGAAQVPQNERLGRTVG